MASPPYTATSPPYSAHAALPSKKRPSISTTDLNPAKRRKPSLASTTSGLHPLRQTSFPPEAVPAVTSQHGYARSPSVDSSIAGSAKPRSRKPKNDARSVTEGSVRGGAARKSGPRANSVATTKTGGKQSRVDEAASRAEAPAEEEEEEDEGDLGAAMTVNGAEQVDEDQERQRLGILLEAFTGDQSDRYDAFRRVKLNPPTVRRLVNQVLSQSVPEGVVKTVNGFTKVFIGEIIERARDVQSQWEAAAAMTTPDDETEQVSAIATNGNAVAAIPRDDAASDRANLPRININTNTVPASTLRDAENLHRESPAPPNPHLQREPRPLQPDHIREAVRRYRRDREGGGAGMKMYSLGGMAGYSVATPGRRLFR